MRMPDLADHRVLFAGLKILVIEDEVILFLLIEDMLNELGVAEAWHAVSIRDALAILDGRRPDAVVLDVNLAGEMAYSIANRLHETSIPFVFVTGYGRGGIPQEWAAHPVIEKPFELQTLAAALGSVLGPAAGNS
jgi:CheY-like chemotaxis protein